MFKAWQNFVESAIDKQNKINNTPWPTSIRGNLNGIANLDNYGVISVSGDDATSFLQGQLTCDVNIENNPNLLFGSYCNLKGRVIAFFRITFWNNCYYLILPKDLVEPTLTELKKYVLIAKVNINEISDTVITAGIVGNDILDELTKLFDKSNKSICMLKQNTSPESALLLINKSDKESTNDEHEQFFYNHLINNNINILSTNEWNLLNINNKIPEVFIHNVDKFLPHNIELPRLNAVSFKKGCYRGQEIISRMQYKATIKKHLEIITLENNEQQNNVENNDITIINQAYNKDNNKVLLIESNKS